jgi:hypothetical protein
MTALPIPVHVGSEPPASWDDIEERQRQFGDEASPWLQKKRRPSIASATLDWGSFGFEPRWVGFDTADCVAALQPSIFAGQGADEFNRFRQAAESRDEMGLVISPVGRSYDSGSRSVLTPYDDSTHLAHVKSSVNSRSTWKGSLAIMSSTKLIAVFWSHRG